MTRGLSSLVNQVSNFIMQRSCSRFSLHSVLKEGPHSFFWGAMPIISPSRQRRITAYHLAWWRPTSEDADHHQGGWPAHNEQDWLLPKAKGDRCRAGLLLTPRGDFRVLSLTCPIRHAPPKPCQSSFRDGGAVAR